MMPFSEQLNRYMRRELEQVPTTRQPNTHSSDRWNILSDGAARRFPCARLSPVPHSCPLSPPRQLEKDSEQFLSAEEAAPTNERAQRRLDHLSGRISTLSGDKAVLQAIGTRLRRHTNLGSQSGLPGMRFGATSLKQAGGGGSSGGGGGRLP